MSDSRWGYFGIVDFYIGSRVTSEAIVYFDPVNDYSYKVKQIELYQFNPDRIDSDLSIVRLSITKRSKITLYSKKKGKSYSLDVQCK